MWLHSVLDGFVQRVYLPGLRWSLRNPAIVVSLAIGMLVVSTGISRGPVVDQAALTEVLREQRIAGAALDVFEKEPSDRHDPLLKLENMILSPHAVGWTDELFRGNGVAASRWQNRPYGPFGKKCHTSPTRQRGRTVQKPLQLQSLACASGLCLVVRDGTFFSERAVKRQKADVAGRRPFV